ncbi:MAG: GNAT family N-acetyltransferase [Rhodospirillaceae bacterium]|nr:GNAT family N-acetyltransferase [Rhodospirillaceae bacterium]MDD9916441.1 GNAT family N-acetyltransferase [Rhodospirillaceae bacterium]MDD9924918.1 GNAT family N-acetyltransferase [Rhodospirillaceae bacterium]
MTVTVRKATPDDKQKCLSFLAALRGEEQQPGWAETYDTLMAGDRGSVLVADDDELGVLGSASISYNVAMRYSGEYCQLEELFVDPAARGKNAGGLLIEGIIAAARERGCAEIGLYLLEWTAHNQPFYEKYGFKVVGAEMRQRLD